MEAYNNKRRIISVLKKVGGLGGEAPQPKIRLQSFQPPVSNIVPTLLLMSIAKMANFSVSKGPLLEFSGGAPNHLGTALTTIHA